MASRASRSIFVAAAAILALPLIAAPAGAQEHEVGHWMPLGSYSTTNAARQTRPLDDLPQAPVLRGPRTPRGGAQPLPGDQPRMGLQRNEPLDSSARGGWYRTQPSLTLRGSDPSPASKGPQIKYQMFNPSGGPAR
jgi:hypothetical protein